MNCAAIERAAEAGDEESILAAARKWPGVSKAALTRHLASHPRAVAPAASSRPRRGRGRPASVVLEEAPAANDDGPATSRSPSGEPSGVTVSGTARVELDAIVTEIRGLRRDAGAKTLEGAFKYSLAERASVLRAAMTASRLLAMLTGELGASEAVIATSPHWKRLEAELLEALRDHPDALKSVVAVLQKKRDAA